MRWSTSLHDGIASLQGRIAVERGGSWGHRVVTVGLWRLHAGKRLAPSPGASLDAIVFAIHPAIATHTYRIRMTSVRRPDRVRMAFVRRPDSDRMRGGKRDFGRLAARSLYGRTTVLPRVARWAFNGTLAAMPVWRSLPENQIGAPRSIADLGRARRQI